MAGQEYAENRGDRLSDETVEDVDENVLAMFYREATRANRLPDFGYDRRTVLSKIGALNGDRLTNSGKYLFFPESLYCP